MLTKTTAIVLHNIKYGDSKMIVDMFTRAHGRTSFVVAIPKSAKSKIRKQLFQPLAMLSLEYDFRPKVQLQKIKEATILHPYSSLPFDMDKLTVGMFISEFLYHSLYGEESNKPMFDYISDSLQWFDSSPSPASNFHLVFMMRLSRFLGFYPNLDDYVQGCVIGLRSGSPFGMLICFGVAAALAFQTFVNIGMCIGITPVVGITLPFFSYGGSSIVAMYAAVGLVSGVKYRPKPRQNFLQYQ